MQSQAQTSGPGLPVQNQGPAAGRSLFDGYTPVAGAYDEMLAADGAPRPAWTALRDRLDRIGRDELGRRWARSQRLIYDNGITYSAYGDPDRPRPWSLDPAPVLLPETDWSEIADGLSQRATLLDRVLTDLFGEQKLVASGLLPAELLYNHPGYLLPLHRRTNQESAAEALLRFYAADLGRSPDGKWWVLADRTEAPSGAGFALENRVVTSRMLAEPFRERSVKRLAPFFIRLQAALSRSAPAGAANPSVAILSQGTGHPNYFEDAYLARYLGHLLVEGGDLTVRNRRVWMKTLDGLAPIDVLLRRPNSELCDPLELGGASPTGVAGLLQATRDDAVHVANGFGSGLVESPVFMAFMPRLCQQVLGEELKLPGVATWWCGEPQSLEFVLDNLDRLILKRAYRQRGEESLLMTQLRETPREELVRLIRSEPHAYAAQEQVNRSTAPAWRDDRIEPVRLALRAFAVADDDGWCVMDGALARTTPDDGPLETSSLSGEESKDVWIVGEGPVAPVTLLPKEQESIELVRLGSEMPSRVADHSYWLGRYHERADAAARLVRTVATRLTSEGDAKDLEELPALMRALAERGLIEPGHVLADFFQSLPHVEQSLPSEVLSHQQPGSLSATIDRLFGSAAQVRDRLSRDTWRIVLRINEKFRGLDARAADLTDLLSLTDELVIDLASVGGMVIESMTRTQFYRFLDIGRRVERAMLAVELIRTCLVESTGRSVGLLEALLESADSLMTYRARYRANVKVAAVLDLLITDETNPRSIAYQLATLERHVGKLPHTHAGEPGSTPEQRLAMSLTTAVRMADVQQVSESHELGRPEPLAELLDRVGRDLPALANAVALKYLAHSGPARQLSPL